MTTARSPRVDRVTSAKAREALERLASSDILAAGGVNLIGLAAIRTHLGDRWLARRDRIWERVERALERRLRPFAMILHLDEAAYLIALPGASRFEAQVACRRCRTS